MGWSTYAFLAALFGGATAILAKVGVEGVPSNLATAVRTVVVLVFAWAIVAARGELSAMRGMAGRTWLFLGLSGIATGLSWLCYFRALQLGPVSGVAPIDKLSFVIAMSLGILLLREPLEWRLVLGAALIVAGVLVVIR